MKATFIFEKEGKRYKADYQGIVKFGGKDVKNFYIFELDGTTWMFKGSCYFSVKSTKKQIIAKIV